MDHRGHATGNNPKSGDGGPNKGMHDASSHQASKDDNKMVTSELDNELHTALKVILKQTEKPMSKGHVYQFLKGIVDIYFSMDSQSQENKQLKEDNEQKSKLMKEIITDRDNKIACIERDRDLWKNQAEQAKQFSEKLKTEQNEQQLVYVSLKRDHEKLKMDMSECNKNNVSRDMKQKELETKYLKLRKSFESQAHELTGSENCRRQMGEKITSLEKSIQIEQASRANLIVEVNALKKEKKGVESKLEAVMGEYAGEREVSRREIADLKTKVQEQDATICKVVQDEIAIRYSPMLMNQLIKMKNTQGGITAVPPSITQYQGHGGPVVKRKVSTEDEKSGKSPGENGAAKKVKVKSGNDETEEEGEIIDQQRPQQAVAPPTPVATSVASVPPPVPPPSHEGNSSKDMRQNQTRNYPPNPKFFRTYSRFDGERGGKRGGKRQ